MRGFKFVALTAKGEEILKKCSVSGDNRVYIDIISKDPFCFTMVFKSFKVRMAMKAALLVGDGRVMASQVITSLDNECVIDVDYEVEVLT